MFTGFFKLETEMWLELEKEYKSNDTTVGVENFLSGIEFKKPKDTTSWSELDMFERTKLSGKVAKTFL